MIYVGIDVSQEKANYAIINSDNKIINQFVLKHSNENFDKLIKILSEFNKKDIILGIESTGNHWRIPTYYLLERDFNIVLLNPFYTHKFLSLISNKTKTDKIDALGIAKYLKTDEFKKSIIPVDSHADIKALVKCAEKIQKQICDQKRAISNTLVSAFFEFKTLFKNIFSVTALTLLKQYPSFKKIASLKPENLVKLFRNIKGNNFNYQKALKIINTAKNSVTPDVCIEQYESILLSQIDILEAMIKAKQNIDKKIDKNLMAPDLKYSDTLTNDNYNIVRSILSIPGVGKKTLAAIIGMCGDLSRFENSTKFVGYIGLYPQIIQSGKKNRTKAHKKGIRIVKKYIHLAAVASIKHNNELNKIFLDAISKGKTKQQALAKVKYKLLKIIWHLYNYRIVYDPSKVFVNKNVA